MIQNLFSIMTGITPEMTGNQPNNKNQNNTASIITAWCLYCHTKVSLVILLLKELQQGCDEGHGKEENFMWCYYRKDSTNWKLK
jgi:hypothetical protein